MAGLLDLPVELRAQILRHVLHKHVAQAPTEDDTEQCCAEERPRSEDNNYHGGYVYPDFTTLEPSSTSVYLVSRQIHEEATAVAGLLHPVEYHLDLVVFKQALELIPTWTYCSRASHVIDVLKCTVRLHGEIDPAVRRCPLSGGDGGPPMFIWRFLDIMNDFFRYGPRLQALDKDENEDNNENDQNPFIIKKLIINTQTPKCGEKVSWWDPWAARYYTHSELDNSDTQQRTVHRLSPEFMHDFLESHMGILLSCTDHTGSYGSSIFTHVGQIEFYKDGEHSTTYNLDAKLSSCLNAPEPSAPKSRWDPRTPLRIWLVQQMWIPCAQHVRASRRLGPKVEDRKADITQESQETDGNESENTEEYKSWNRCYELVRLTRPELR